MEDTDPTCCWLTQEKRRIPHTVKSMVREGPTGGWQMTSIASNEVICNSPGPWVGMQWLFSLKLLLQTGSTKFDQVERVGSPPLPFLAFRCALSCKGCCPRFFYFFACQVALQANGHARVHLDRFPSSTMILRIKVPSDVPSNGNWKTK